MKGNQQIGVVYVLERQVCIGNGFDDNLKNGFHLKVGYFLKAQESKNKLELEEISQTYVNGILYGLFATENPGNRGSSKKEVNPKSSNEEKSKWYWSLSDGKHYRDEIGRGYNY